MRRIASWNSLCPPHLPFCMVNDYEPEGQRFEPLGRATPESPKGPGSQVLFLCPFGGRLRVTANWTTTLSVRVAGAGERHRPHPPHRDDRRSARLILAPESPDLTRSPASARDPCSNSRCQRRHAFGGGAGLAPGSRPCPGSSHFTRSGRHESAVRAQTPTRKAPAGPAMNSTPPVEQNTSGACPACTATAVGSCSGSSTRERADRPD